MHIIRGNGDKRRNGTEEQRDAITSRPLCYSPPHSCGSRWRAGLVLVTGLGIRNNGKEALYGKITKKNDVHNGGEMSQETFFSVLFCVMLDYVL